MAVAKDFQSLRMPHRAIRYCKNPRIPERQYKSLKKKENVIFGGKKSLH